MLKIYFNGNHLSEGGYATEYICTVYISVVMLYGVREYGVLNYMYITVGYGVCYISPLLRL